MIPFIAALTLQPNPWITPEVKAPGLSYGTFESAAAKTKVSYHILLPEAHAQQPNATFPVLYWLHGSGGGLPGIPSLAQHFREAIAAKKTPPFIVVFVNGMPNGMYVDWKDGSVPMEQVIIRDLLPHIETTYRASNQRQLRLIEGFSMGGYGAARLGFKYPELFRNISILGAGPLQENLLDAPRMQQRAADVLRRVYGNDPAHFLAVSPRTLAQQNAPTLKKDTLIRVVIGQNDNTLPANQAFHEHLTTLGIPHAWTVLPGVGHETLALFRALGDPNWNFYRKALSTPAGL